MEVLVDGDEMNALKGINIKKFLLLIISLVLILSVSLYINELFGLTGRVTGVSNTCYFADSDGDCLITLIDLIYARDLSLLRTPVGCAITIGGIEVCDKTLDVTGDGVVDASDVGFIKDMSLLKRIPPGQLKGVPNIIEFIKVPDFINENTPYNVTLKVLTKTDRPSVQMGVTVGEETKFTDINGEVTFTIPAGVNTISAFIPENLGKLVSRVEANTTTHVTNRSMEKESMCREDDGGINWFDKGVTVGIHKGKAGHFTDYCQDSSRVVEYYCVSSNSLDIGSAVQYCGGGCVNGGCNRPEKTFKSCDSFIVGHNNLYENRINIIFVNVGLEKGEFRKHISRIIDYDNNNQNLGFREGFLDFEPMKSNKDKFNFLILNNTKLDSRVLTDDSQVGSLLQELSGFNEVCNFEDNYYVFIVNVDNLKNDISRALYKRAVVGVRGQLSNTNTMFPTVATHESVHSIFRLADEYWYGLGGGKHWRYSPEIVWNWLRFSEQCYYNKNVDCRIITMEGGYSFSACYPTESAIKDCEMYSPWHDLIGTGCGQDGKIDCNVGDDGYDYEINCGNLNTFLSCGGFEDVMRSSLSSNMYNLGQSKFNVHQQRLICKELRKITGPVSSVCNNLCLDGCGIGERCIGGVCTKV